MTFTPWTTAEDLADMLAFIEAHGLVERVPPVQYGLRLLLPPGSPLIAPTHAQGLLGDYNTEALTYEWRPHWTSAWTRSSARSPASSPSSTPTSTRATPARSASCATRSSRRRGGPTPATAAPPRVLPATPGLTESWFC